MNADEVRERLRAVEDPALGDGVSNVILNSKHLVIAFAVRPLLAPVVLVVGVLLTCCRSTRSSHSCYSPRR